MRIFTATLATETNTFAPIPTALANFEDALLARPGEHPKTPTLCTAPLWVGRRRAAEEGFELVEGTCAWAEPSGTCAKATYESLRDEILDQLRAAMPVDGVVMGLHGAMVAHGYDDCEGDLLSRIRSIVGPDVPIGVEHDPHCHLTDKRLEACDLLICFKEFPHTDSVDRAEEVVDLTLRQIRGEIRPVMSVFDCRMIASMPTSREPMRSFVDRIKAMEGKGNILSISIAHGFAFGDVPEMGTRILVVTNDDREAGDALAEKLGRELYAMRKETLQPYLKPAELLDLVRAGGASPIVAADPSDNAGGGAASDSTFLLNDLLAAGITDVAIGPIWDPIAARHCAAAGEGARFPLRFGGKTAPQSGPPVDAEVEVLRVEPAHRQSFAGGHVEMGLSVAIRLAGIDVVLVSKRSQALAPDLFTGVGIDPAAKRLVVVKSTNHFHAAFAPIAADIVYVDSGSFLPRDLRSLDYRKIARPKWPFDEDPFAA